MWWFSKNSSPEQSQNATQKNNANSLVNINYVKCATSGIVWCDDRLKNISNFMGEIAQGRQGCAPGCGCNSKHKGGGQQLTNILEQ